MNDVPSALDNGRALTGGDRIRFLDGLRGIAIFAVIIFHAYVRWPEAVPYGDRFSGVPIVAYGWLGVQLFFLISGFVIFLTLEKCAHFKEFIQRRWLRLFPGMLFCSVLIFVTAPIFHERPAGPVAIRDLLPGLTFVDPAWWDLIFESPQGVVEGAFWSIFVEVKFYLVAGFLYFRIGGNAMIGTLIALFLGTGAAAALERNAPGVDLRGVTVVMALLGAKYFGWFAAGALYYRYFHERRRILLELAILVALASALMQDGYQYRPEVFALLVVIAFSTAVVSRFAQWVLANPVLLLLGFISYPLYLIHENMMVAAIAKVGKAAPWMPTVVMPAVPVLLVCGLGWLTAAYVEPWLRAKLRFLVRIETAQIENVPRL